ncbi:MAG TPA: TIGR03560 family F420-dependent LLM class oxidoreductase [Candidatus Limnocylindrales bacterium]|nr:TIGR03560 family F420-dependent LLM class oxidoreductase [Candidatus Limnocylindrales bacterium]
MRFALMTEPQMGLTYADQLAVVQRAEQAGFEAFFRSDHYESFPGETDQPTTDAWAVLAGLARDTSRIGLGVLVSPVTFRTPGNLAKVAVTVDEMSGGRVEVGVGAGWHADEHRRHGFPFPDIAERADMLEETLEILRGLWDGPDGWSFEGAHYAIEDAFFRPKPASQPWRDGRPIRILTGGQGSPRAYRIAAKHADEFNLSSTSPDVATTKYAKLDDACRAIGRDPSSVTHSAMVGLLIGRTPAEVRDREQALVAAFGGADDESEEWLEARRPRWIYGTPEEARRRVRAFAEAGVQRLMFQDFLARDLEMIDLAAEVLFDAAP